MTNLLAVARYPCTLVFFYRLDKQIVQLYFKRMKTIKEIITDRGLTIKQASAACDLPIHTVISHFYGRRRGMTLGTARKYARGLGVDVSEIMVWEELFREWK